jgi:hypothetical protein
VKDVYDVRGGVGFSVGNGSIITLVETLVMVSRPIVGKIIG